MAIDRIERMRSYTAAVREHGSIRDMKENDSLISIDNESIRAIDTEGNDDHLQYLIPTLLIGIILQQLFTKKNNGTLFIISTKCRQEGMKKANECLTPKEVSCARKLIALQRKIEYDEERSRQGDLWNLLMSEAPLLLTNEQEN